MDLDLLHRTFRIQNPSGDRKGNRRAIETVIRMLPPDARRETRDGNLLVTKGEGPMPFFVAHLDQVHRHDEAFSLRIEDGHLMARSRVSGKRLGVGGDDKSGIFIALTALAELPRAGAVFFRDEEIGCLGSESAPLEWFDDASLILQCDRRHDQPDLVRNISGYRCAPDEFVEAVLALPEADGWREAERSSTDLGALAARGLAVAALNLSAGYLRPHSDEEFVDLRKLESAKNLALAIGRELGSKTWDHDAEPIRSASWLRESKFPTDHFPDDE